MRAILDAYAAAFHRGGPAWPSDTRTGKLVNAMPGAGRGRRPGWKSRPNAALTWAWPWQTRALALGDGHTWMATWCRSALLHLSTCLEPVAVEPCSKAGRHLGQRRPFPRRGWMLRRWAQWNPVARSSAQRQCRPPLRPRRPAVRIVPGPGLAVFLRLLPGRQRRRSNRRRPPRNATSPPSCCWTGRG